MLSPYKDTTCQKYPRERFLAITRVVGCKQFTDCLVWRWNLWMYCVMVHIGLLIALPLQFIFGSVLVIGGVSLLLLIIYGYSKKIRIPNFPTIQPLTWHPLISAKTRHWVAWIASRIKMTPVSIRIKTPTDICRIWKAMIQRCRNTSFILTQR